MTACFDPGVGHDGDTDAATDSTGATETSPTTPTTDPSTSGPTSDDPTSDTMPTTDDTTSSMTSTSLDDSTGSTSGGPEILECVEGILRPSVGNGLAQANTDVTGSDFEGSCGGVNTKDVAYQWMVPFTDFFVLDTQGSNYDTVLYVLDDTCDGPELACNNDAEGSVSSRIVAKFHEDQRVVVVLDGNAGESGTAVLNINPVECPSADLTEQALPATFSNIAGSNNHEGSCGGAGNPERAFRYTAPQEGLYSFRVTSKDFVPIAYLEDGPVCGSPRLQCNRTAPSEAGSEVIRRLAAGQSATLIVDSDGGTGDFEVDITEIGLACPAEPLSSGPPLTRSINNYDHAMTTSCGPSAELVGAQADPYPAATFSFTSPGQIGTNSGCSIDVVSGFPAALSLQRGSCDGPEEQCETTSFDNGQQRYTASVTVGHIPPTEFTVTLIPTEPTWSGWLDSNFSIEVSCWAIA